MLKPDYSIISNNYDKNVDRLSIQREDDIRIKLLENKTIRILDLGCGTGNYIRSQNEYYSHDRNIEWFGIDASSEMLNIANEKLPYAKLIHSTAEQMELVDNYFDIVVCNFAFHQFENKNAVLDNVYKILKNDGLFIQKNINPEMMKDWWVYKYCPNTYYEDLHRFWAKELVVYELEKRKFKVYIDVNYQEDYRSYSILKEDYSRRDVSQLSMIDDDSYYIGLKKIEDEIQKGSKEFKNIFSLIKIKGIK